MYTSLLYFVYSFIIIKGTSSAEVYMNEALTDMLLNSSTILKCTFDVSVSIVDISSTNKTGDFNTIAIFKPFLQAKLTNEGNYLRGRVNLSNITYDSRNASITINDLRCIDEREYKCKITYTDNNSVRAKESNPTNITIQVKPSKPESIEIMGKLVDNGILSTTENSPTGATMESENSGTFTTDVPTQPNNMYESGPITEGDNVTFSCSGNVGKPPISFKWEKIQSSGAITTYNDTNTDIIYHSENCSYHRTSNITLKMLAEDNNATVRCVVAESVISDDKLYAETDAIDVLYKVRLPNITKQPDKEMYGKETKSITLTCNSDGNPKPAYVWSKNGNILHNESVMVISNVTVNDSGTYMCNVSNNEMIMYWTSVSIVIVKEIVTTTTTIPAASGSTMKDERSTTKNDTSQQTMYIIIGVAGIVVLAGIIAAIVVVCKRKRRTKGYDNNLTDKRTKSSPKPQRSADSYYSINLEDKPKKDVRDENTYKENEKHNLQYLKHEEVKAKETKPPEAPDEYAVVDKTKHKYMNSVNKDEVPEDPYALQSEGVYDTANDRRHKPDDHAETYDTTDMKKKSQPANGSEGSQEPTAKPKAYENQSFIDDTNDNTKDANKPLYQNEKQETKTNTSF